MKHKAASFHCFRSVQQIKKPDSAVVDAPLLHKMQLSPKYGEKNKHSFW